MRSLFGLKSSGLFKRGHLFWYLDLTEGIDFSIFLLGAFEPQTQSLYRRILKDRPQAVVFDIGANVGSHTLPLAQLVCPTGGRVVAFEPTVWAVEKLRRNLDLNPILQGVDIEHAMLVERVDGDEAAFKQPIYSSWPLQTVKNDLLHPVHGGKLHDIGNAKAIRLDDYVRELSPPNIVLMKIDVDGHEPQVIAGSWQTIERFRPDIILEWSPHLFQDQPGAMEAIVERFLGLCYQIFHADTMRYLTLPTLYAITPKGGSINILLSARKSL